MKDHEGKSLAYVYFEDEPGRRSAAKMLTPVNSDILSILVSQMRQVLSHDAVTIRSNPKPFTWTKDPNKIIVAIKPHTEKC